MLKKETGTYLGLRITAGRGQIRRDERPILQILQSVPHVLLQLHGSAPKKLAVGSTAVVRGGMPKQQRRAPAVSVLAAPPHPLLDTQLAKLARFSSKRQPTGRVGGAGCQGWQQRLGTSVQMILGVRVSVCVVFLGVVERARLSALHCAASVPLHGLRARASSEERQMCECLLLGRCRRFLARLVPQEPHSSQCRGKQH